MVNAIVVLVYLLGTIMAANVAAIYLVGPAGAAYGGGGVSVLLIVWAGNMIAAGSTLVFVPRLRRLRITTVSEFLETRYSLGLRLLVAGWEKHLPRPHNLLAFVFGCYLAAPTFVPDAAEGQETRDDAIDNSLVQRVLGSGWSWLAMGSVALALVIILYQV